MTSAPGRPALARVRYVLFGTRARHLSPIQRAVDLPLRSIPKFYSAPVSCTGVFPAIMRAALARRLFHRPALFDCFCSVVRPRRATRGPCREGLFCLRDRRHFVRSPGTRRRALYTFLFGHRLALAIPRYEAFGEARRICATPSALSL